MAWMYDHIVGRVQDNAGRWRVRVALLNGGIESVEELKFFTDPTNPVLQAAVVNLVEALNRPSPPTSHLRLRRLRKQIAERISGVGTAAAKLNDIQAIITASRDTDPDQGDE